MMEFYEEQLDLTKHKLIEIEKSLAVMQDNITTLSEQLKETQRYLIKLAYAQNEISKRIVSWPYIAVPESNNKGD